MLSGWPKTMMRHLANIRARGPLPSPSDGAGIIHHKVDRRKILQLGLAAWVVGLAPRTALAAVGYSESPERRISFYNPHTGESLKAVYWVKGTYVPGALDDINHILRDYRTDEVKPIDTGLLDLLHALHAKLQVATPFHIISGYRSATTNALLRRKSRGVARNSLHIRGEAADIRLPDVDLATVRQAAIDLKGGGVGFYRRSNFVHVDIGKLRYW